MSKIKRIRITNYRGIEELDVEVPAAGAIAKGTNGRRTHPRKRPPRTEERKPVVMYRQGDVLIVPLSTAPAKPGDLVDREGGRVVLAHGEVTGHAHAIRSKSAKLFASGDKRTLVASKPVVIEHEEHDPITLPKGAYQVIRQREYSPEAIRNVAD